MLTRLTRKCVGADLGSATGRAIVEERYGSLRKQVPIVYLLGFVNLSAMEMASSGHLSVGINLPTFIALCGLVRTWQWFRAPGPVDHEVMIARMTQTLWFAAAVCLAVCARCLHLLEVGDSASHMAVILFGGLTAIGVAYGLTALPVAGRIPLVLIIVPISLVALLSNDPHFAGAAFGLVVVAALTMRLLNAHSRHFADVISSRSAIARQQEMAELAHRDAVAAATTDFLTSLPNRRAFVAALETASGTTSEPYTVAILDLDRFKAVNDMFGHGSGDQLLQEVALRLRKAVGERGLVARLGGDEFGILLPGIGRTPDARSLGEEIVEHVNGPVFLAGRQFIISACCGLGIARRGDQKPPSRVMADADLALYQAKESPTVRMALFERRMEAPRRRRAQIESALLEPGSRNNLKLVYQPIFDLANGQVIAHEALARWNDPELGAVPPSEFVPIAEHLNLIDTISSHLMGIAFNEARCWPGHVRLSFNLSAIQLCSSASAKAILSALADAGLGAERLQVEVTETALLADFERARENLTELKSAGATIVLDDFGAGYASIGYLRELRFDQIKLDGGLVTAAQHSVDGKRLLCAVIALCEILGVSSIAEHVESEELLKLVVELGCSGAQGFWLKAPVGSEELHKVGERIIPVRKRAA